MQKCVYYRQQIFTDNEVLLCTKLNSMVWGGRE